MGQFYGIIVAVVTATWEGIQAAKQLEEQGVATHIILVYRCASLPCFSNPKPCIGSTRTLSSQCLYILCRCSGSVEAQAAVQQPP